MQQSHPYLVSQLTVLDGLSTLAEASKPTAVAAAPTPAVAAAAPEPETPGAPVSQAAINSVTYADAASQPEAAPKLPTAAPQRTEGPKSAAPEPSAGKVKSWCML